MTASEGHACPLCKQIGDAQQQLEYGWAPPEVKRRLAAVHADLHAEDGVCPACVQQALLEVLLKTPDDKLHETIQAAWPLDIEAALGALPIPIRMHADPNFTGKGVTLAMIDSGFFPHPDLTRPKNRIKAWANASKNPVEELHFLNDSRPEWPMWHDLRGDQWHGLMTACSAAGNGFLSHGLYRGLACESELVLIRTADDQGRITDDSILRAVHWVRDHAEEMEIRVVNISVTGDTAGAGGPIDRAIEELSERNITTVAAAGNSGERRLFPPATAARALTVGGLDDRNALRRQDAEVWHSNFGETEAGFTKPEVVAPSIWVVAPLLPDTDEAKRAQELFERRRAGDEAVEHEIAERKLVRPEYKLTEGTSFAAPIVASVVCCMLQANPHLSPDDIHKLVISSAFPVPGATIEQQGAGAVDAGTSVAFALRATKGALAGYANSPFPHAGGVRFLLFRSGASRVEVRGSWNDWSETGLEAAQLEPGVWIADLQGLPPGRYAYKFLIDGTKWIDDPSNSRKAPDGAGRFNTVLIVPGAEAAA